MQETARNGLLYGILARNYHIGHDYEAARCEGLAWIGPKFKFWEIKIWN